MLLLGCLFTRILCTGCYTPLFYSTWTPNTLFCIHPFTQAHMCFQTLSHIYTTMDASHSNSPPTLGMQTCSTSWATATPLAALQQKTAQKLTKISAQGIACLFPPNLFYYEHGFFECFQPSCVILRTGLMTWLSFMWLLFTTFRLCGSENIDFYWRFVDLTLDTVWIFHTT